MPATNKADLLAVTLREYDKLEAVIAPLGPDQLCQKDAGDGMSIKDIIAHRAHWLGLLMSWYEDGCAGLDVSTPAPGYKWNQLKAYNAHIQASSQDFDWQVIWQSFTTKHQALVAWIQDMDADRLYQAQLYPWMNKWTLGRWAEANGPSHYRSATKVVRQYLRAQQR